MSIFPGYIKVNLPRNQVNFETGNGEGIWVKVDENTEKLHDDDFTGGLFRGTLANDSTYYPLLMCGDTIIFTMRGDNRPVAIYNGFLENFNAIEDNEKEALIKRLLETKGIED